MDKNDLKEKYIRILKNLRKIYWKLDKIRNKTKKQNFVKNC